MPLLIAVVILLISAILLTIADPNALYVDGVVLILTTVIALLWRSRH
jgi:hypothetical protein